MGQYLDYDRWFDRTPTGTFRMKRVSAENEARFPQEFRIALRDGGAVGLVKAVMAARGVSLGEAWELAKEMVGMDHNNHTT